MLKKVRNDFRLQCMKCEKIYCEPQDKVLYNCPSCGYEGILDVLIPYDAVQKGFINKIKNREFSDCDAQGIWRYLPLLPLNQCAPPPALQTGPTPLYNSTRLNKYLGLKSVFLKDDGRNPTASLKDRASAVGVARAMELGSGVLAAASTGNAACSLSGFAAAAGIPCYIFVPVDAPAAKIAQLLVFGARVLQVQGNYDTAWELCYNICSLKGWYNRSCAINPYLVEGKKTVAYELVEQLALEPPDRVYVGVGDGCIISGLYKGFYDLKELNIISRIPRLFGVQASLCQPLKMAWETGGEPPAVEPRTIADSIAVGKPRNWRKAMRAVQKSRGKFLDVSDEEIIEAISILGNTAGIFAEPAGAAGFAGLIKSKILNDLDSSEKIAVLITGNGLKDIGSVKRIQGITAAVPPDEQEILRILESDNKFS